MFLEIVDYLSRADVWIAFLTLSLLEIVLGIDNVIFISIAANKLSEKARGKARALGLFLALIMRVAVLWTIVVLVRKTAPIFSFGDFNVSWRDLVLCGGGLFLLYKATVEIGAELKGVEASAQPATASVFGLVVIQIVLLDLVFSIDSIFTAVGLSRKLPVMIAAIVVAILVMMLASGVVGGFIHRHPTIKMLALAFLVMVALALLGDAGHLDIDRIYLYGSIAFSFIVEILSLTLLRGARRLSALIFVPCAALLIGALCGARSMGLDIDWSYVAVPISFGLIVQVLNALAHQARTASRLADG